MSAQCEDDLEEKEEEEKANEVRRRRRKRRRRKRKLSSSHASQAHSAHAVTKARQRERAKSGSPQVCTHTLVYHHDAPPIFLGGGGWIGTWINTVQVYNLKRLFFYWSILCRRVHMDMWWREGKKKKGIFHLLFLTYSFVVARTNWCNKHRSSKWHLLISWS